MSAGRSHSIKLIIYINQATLRVVARGIIELMNDGNTIYGRIKIEQRARTVSNSSLTMISHAIHGAVTQLMQGTVRISDTLHIKTIPALIGKINSIKTIDVS